MLWFSYDNRDSIIYNGKEYFYLEYNEDTFYYYFNSNSYYEEDIIYPVEHNKCDFVYLSGDLFVYEKDFGSARKYYSNDDNYEWMIIIDVDDSEVEFNVKLTEDETDSLYNMDNIKDKEQILFSKIEKFGTIVKVSNDKMVKSVLSIAYYDGNWYWKTEIMDNEDDDLEYAVKLPESLSILINNLL